jgi:hypothetical protein
MAQVRPHGSGTPARMSREMPTRESCRAFRTLVWVSYQWSPRAFGKASRHSCCGDLTFAAVSRNRYFKSVAPDPRGTVSTDEYSRYCTTRLCEVGVRPSGGIGRRSELKIRFHSRGVGVRVPPGYDEVSHFNRLETGNLAPQPRCEMSPKKVFPNRKRPLCRSG